MRRTATIVISTDGRDKGKTFILTELPAMRAESWAMRAFLALAKSGIEIPDEYVNSGIAGLFSLFEGSPVGKSGVAAIAGMSGFIQQVVGRLPYDDIRPLLDEMMAAVMFVPDVSRPEVTLSWSQAVGQVEEISTILQLRRDILKLHAGFFGDAARSA
jgi:hypothetical protein